MSPVPRMARTPLQTRVLPRPGFAVRPASSHGCCSSFHTGDLVCRPFFRPASLCPSHSVFSRVAIFSQASSLVATVTQSFEDVLVSAGTVQVVPTDNRKDSILP